MLNLDLTNIIAAFLWDKLNITAKFLEKQLH